MTAQWRLRRLASRALKVLERNESASPAIAAFEGPMETSARGYIKAYALASGYEAKWRVEMAEGRGAMAELKRELDVWKPHVARERPGFDLTSIADRPTVPEDLIEDALALADELDAVRDERGRTVAWAAGGAKGIRAKADTAEKETDEAAAADAKYSTLLAEVRNTAAVFQAELGRFRETLRGVLGSTHPDVVKLRTTRAGTTDVDDDPTAPQPADPAAPAPEPPAS